MIPFTGQWSTMRHNRIAWHDFNKITKGLRRQQIRLMGLRYSQMRLSIIYYRVGGCGCPASPDDHQRDDRFLRALRSLIEHKKLIILII